MSTIGPRSLLGCACVIGALLMGCASGDSARSGPSPAGAARIVEAPAGAIEGRIEGSLRVFRGIPYAQPPIGEARWKPPRPLGRWEGVRDASRFGPGCVTPSNFPESIYTSVPIPTSEDCLHLNIWAPVKAENAPVLVWIHGGAFWAGSGRDPLHDGAQLAARGDIVVVTLNYRLGPLGWLAHAELSAEANRGVSGNYGLLDLILGLQWVRDNIAAFGGDPGNVTIAGESAGGTGVLYLMSAPKARGLFHRAIAQSAYMTSLPALKQARHGLPSAEDSGAHLARALNVADVNALRSIDAQKLTDAAVTAQFWPTAVVDGEIVPEQIVEILDRGEQAPVPALAGFNSGEIRSLRMLAAPTPESAEVYEARIRERYRDLADAFLDLYPSSDMQQSILAATRDALYGWTAQRLAAKQTELGATSYLYLFDHGYPAAVDADLHAFHASELPYVFGTFDKTPKLWPKVPDTQQERAYSHAMTGYWASFARSGTPTAENAPAWPAYDDNGAYMHFAEYPTPSASLMPGMYALHESVVCRRRASGDQPWHWNVGIVSPPLPDPVSACARR